MESENQNQSSVNGKTGGADDNLMAAIAHVGIFWIIVPLVIWLVNKDKSRYVEFQAKQALVYQLVVSVAFFVLAVASWLLTFILAVISGGILGILGVLFMLGLLFLGFAAFVYALYGAYQSYQGKDFKYAVIGNMLSK